MGTIVPVGRMPVCPWGAVQQRTRLAEGIESVSTASHGGILLSAERMRRMPHPYKNWRSTYAPPGCYEEDCDWAIPVLAFAAEMKPQDVATARRTVLEMPDYFGVAIVAAAQAVNVLDWEHVEA